MKKGMVFLCVTQLHFPQKVAFNFLRAIKKEWNGMYTLFECVRASEGQMTSTFRPSLKRKMVLEICYYLYLSLYIHIFWLSSYIIQVKQHIHLLNSKMI